MMALVESAAGNTIVNWGAIPFAYAMRSYGGIYVIAREFPDAADAPLPADPSASTWFDTWPYSTTNITLGSVIAYSDTDYYTSGPLGILPFRGFSAIGVDGLSSDIAVSGNTCIGDTSSSGGGFTYANDFGFTIVHPTNSASNVGGENCTITGNVFKNCHIAEIYHPEYHDLINTNGLAPTAHYAANMAATANIQLPDLAIKPGMSVTQKNHTAGTGLLAVNAGANGATGATGATGSIGLGYENITSSTSLAVGTGSKTFTTDKSATETAFAVGQTIRAFSISTPASFMAGIITSFTGTTLVMSVSYIGGSGTYTDWSITATGAVYSDPIAIGAGAGSGTFPAGGIAIGLNAASTSQGSGSVAIGSNSASTQGAFSVAIGSSAGGASQGTNSISIGYVSGGGNQSASIGTGAGSSADSVFVGHNAGNVSGANSVCIGSLAANKSGT